jgi:hypothetical protein
VSPVETGGDGRIDATDVTVVRLYALGVLPPTPTGGPAGPANTLPDEEREADEANRPGASRIIRAVSTSSAAGRHVTVQIQLDSQGNEASLSFTLNFNPNVMTYVAAEAGNGVPAGTNLSLNTSQTAQGRLGVLLDATNSYPAGTRQVVAVTFLNASNIPSGQSYPISFSSAPTLQSTADLQGTLLPTSYEAGSVLCCNQMAGRTVRAVNSAAVSGSNVVIPMQLDSLGDEASLSYTVNFDPTKLSYVSATAGLQVPAGTVLNLNTTQVAQGRLGVLLDSTNTYAPGTRQILTVTFAVAANATSSTTSITFGSAPTLQSVSNSRGDLLIATIYEPGNVVLSPTTASVSISGRVTNVAGQGLRNAVVTLTDASGNRRTATTGSFGIYTFTDVGAGGSYVVGVSPKRYRFASRTVNVTDSLADVDFAAIE